VGYETRIEAAIRSFENHYRAPDPPAVPSAAPEVLAPRYTDDLSDKTVFFPVWDPLTAPLITARLRRHGLDARMLEPTPDSLAKGLRHNTAQCMPLGVIAQEFMDAVEKQRLDPARTVLWMPKSQLSCNLGLFLQQIRFILHQHGLDGAGVYPADMSFRDLSLRLPLDIYLTHLCGGMIRKMACRVRPYEVETGQTDQAVDAALSDLVKAFENGGDVEQAAIEAAERFDRIEVRPGRRPQAAIFGDLYVRDNEVMNQGLIRHIEAAGGEVVTTPYSRFVQLIAPAYFKRWKGERRWRDLLVMRSYLALIQRLEKRYQRIFTKITGLDDGARPDHPEHVLAPYRVRIEQHGESVDNLIKIHHLKEHHPNLRLLIQTSPSFCCPSIVTEAMADLIERETGLSVVSITYDGAGGLKNEAVLPYLKSLT
jgi:predicted nucleotide-binding protein (sugar kinase/HSP70/actin superfamily)